MPKAVWDSANNNVLMTLRRTSNDTVAVVKLRRERVIGEVDWIGPDKTNDTPDITYYQNAPFIAYKLKDHPYFNVGCKASNWVSSGSWRLRGPMNVDSVSTGGPCLWKRLGLLPVHKHQRCNFC